MMIGMPDEDQSQQKYIVDERIDATEHTLFSDLKDESKLLMNNNHDLQNDLSNHELRPSE